MKTPNAFFSARVLCVPFVLSVLFLAPLRAADTANPAADTAGKPDARAVAAAESVNWLGIELLKKNGAPGENALFSPYSIDMEIALAYASANGTTRPEIAQALHFPKAAEDCFGKLLHWTEQAGQTPADAGKEDGTGKQDAGGAKPAAPVEMLFANRIYVQAGLDLNANLLAQLKLNYDTAMVPVDFAKDPAAAAHGINDWISQQTMQHIPNLVPDGALDQTTNLVLANAIYLKAPWSKGFRADLTKPAPFHVGGDMTEVPMMRGYDVKLGLARHEGYTAIAIPYAGSKWQFLILLPDKSDGLAALEAKLTPELLRSCLQLKVSLMDISLPKFKSDPPTVNLDDFLQGIGMKTAFGYNANFSRITLKSLKLTGVFHKSYLSVDEQGTEAAAATAIAMAASDGDAPDDIHVDHPFIYAVQDCQTGACLFLGRMADPRPNPPVPRHQAPTSE